MCVQFIVIHLRVHIVTSISCTYADVDRERERECRYAISVCLPLIDGYED